MRKFLILIFVFLLSLSVYANDSTNRFEIFIGMYEPLGEFDAGNVTWDFKTGGTLGLSFHHALNDFFKIGAFLDFYSFSSEELYVYFGSSSNTAHVDFDIFTVAFGLSTELKYDIERLQLYGRGDLGIASNSMTMNVNWDSYSSDEIDDDGTSFLFALEGGARYYFTEFIDAGLGVKYTYNKQEIDIGGYTEDIDLGGLTIKLALGLNF